MQFMLESCQGSSHCPSAWSRSLRSSWCSHMYCMCNYRGSMSEPDTLIGWFGAFNPVTWSVRIFFIHRVQREFRKPPWPRSHRCVDICGSSWANSHWSLLHHSPVRWRRSFHEFKSKEKCRRIHLLSGSSWHQIHFMPPLSTEMAFIYLSSKRRRWGAWEHRIISHLSFSPHWESPSRDALLSKT